MADKREQCKKCKRNCPTYIVKVKLEKGRIPFEECMDFVPIQTNAEKIRSMTDEELAEFLCEISMCKPDYCPAYLECMKTEYGTMTTWLQSEAE